MKKTTNEEIFENVRNNGDIKEQEIRLLKNRSNNEGHDVFDYNLLDRINDGYGIPVTPEQGAKGLQWLRSLIKGNGEPRKGQPLDYRELEIIRDTAPEDFTFCGFYNLGRHGYPIFTPVYSVLGMKYYNDGGKISIVG
jgi:hypothetical protein